MILKTTDDVNQTSDQRQAQLRLSPVACLGRFCLFVDGMLPTGAAELFDFDFIIFALPA